MFWGGQKAFAPIASRKEFGTPDPGPPKSSEQSPRSPNNTEILRITEPEPETGTVGAVFPNGPCETSRFLMSRGKNCPVTIFVSQLPRNYPHRRGNFERGKNALSCGEETVWEAF